MNPNKINSLLNCMGTNYELVPCSNTDFYKSLRHMFSDLQLYYTKYDDTYYTHVSNNYHLPSHSHYIFNMITLYTLLVHTLKVYMYHRSIVSMSKTLTREFFGKEADFFNSGFIKISEIKELDRESSAVAITFEVENK